MSSDQHPAPYNLQDGFQGTMTESAAMLPMHSDALDLERFMMERNNQSRHASIHTPPQHDLLHQHPPFGNYHFPYNNLMEASVHTEQHPNQSLDAHNFPGQTDLAVHRTSITSTQSDHRGSTSSLHPDHRLSVTSTPAPRSNLGYVAPQSRHISVGGGSDEASPTGGLPSSNAFNDDFGLSGGDNANGHLSNSRQKEDKKEAQPSWTELKTKAGKERKRLPLACIACRRKKIKCSGEKPACKHCIRSRIPCVYKVTTRKVAPRTDYMAMLDKRLKRMEERIIKIVPVEENATTPTSVARAVVKPAIPGTGSPKRGRKRAADEAFEASLDDWSHEASAANIDAVKPPSLMVQELEENQLMLEGAESLPPKDIQEHLAEVYFAHIYGQTYHLLHKPSYLRKLRSGSHPPVLVLTVCAISARFSTHPKLSTKPAFLRGEDWAAKAREIVMRRYEWPNITILTCLLILGLHEFGTCHGGRSWSLGGQAIRMAYALQLHQDLDYDPQKRNGSSELSFIDREIRRRTMWSCFLMDRFNSSGTDRPSFIKEETIKVQLPIREKLFQLDMPGPTETLFGGALNAAAPQAGQLADAQENMGVAAYMVRTIALWGRVINYLNLGGSEQDSLPRWHKDSHFADLVRQTEEFEASLPQTLKYNAENLRIHQTEGLDNQYLFLHIATQQNILFLNRFAVPGQPGGGSPKGAPKEFLTKAGTKAFKAANKISEILSASATHFVTAPFAGYCAFSSSTVHISGIFSQNQSLEQICKKNLTINVAYLTKMKQYWGMFHWMAENLKEQYRLCADSAKSGIKLGGDMEKYPKDIFQYGDWFDRYPYGVKPSDFDEAGRMIKKEEGDKTVLDDKSDYATVEEFFNALPATGACKVGATNPPKNQSRNKGVKKSKAEQRASPTALLTTMPQTATLPLQLPQQSQNYQPGHLPSQPVYNDISPISNIDLYHQQSPYLATPTSSFPPSQQFAVMPQLDRQFVFNSYASTEGADNMLDPLQNTWNHSIPTTGPMGGVSSMTNNQSASAWFMPFNMIPPEINGAGEFSEGFGNFASVGDVSYGNEAMDNRHRGSH